jgi:ubiquinol-cytochrome c reductase iron-sulfur subunit
VGAVGTVGVAVPFVASWNPSAKAKSLGAPVEVDISKLQPGQLIRVKWRGKPVWIVSRTPEMLAEIAKIDDKLRDPDSVEPQQPAYAQNKHRSIKPEILVAIGICTHLGCSPTYVPETFSEQVVGVNFGFLCPCHGSKFDLSGRVFQSVPAPTNLVIPPYHFVDDTTILVGVDPEGEA